MNAQNIYNLVFLYTFKWYFHKRAPRQMYERSLKLSYLIILRKMWDTSSTLQNSPVIHAKTCIWSGLVCNILEHKYVCNETFIGPIINILIVEIESIMEQSIAVMVYKCVHVFKCSSVIHLINGPVMITTSLQNVHCLMYFLVGHISVPYEHVSPYINIMQWQYTVGWHKPVALAVHNRSKDLQSIGALGLWLHGRCCSRLKNNAR